MTDHALLLFDSLYHISGRLGPLEPLELLRRALFLVFCVASATTPASSSSLWRCSFRSRRRARTSSRKSSETALPQSISPTPAGIRTLIRVAEHQIGGHAVFITESGQVLFDQIYRFLRDGGTFVQQMPDLVSQCPNAPTPTQLCRQRRHNLFVAEILTTAPWQSSVPCEDACLPGVTASMGALVRGCRTGPA
jgi:hypothetical protein